MGVGSMRLVWLPLFAFRFFFRILPLLLIGVVVWLIATRRSRLPGAATRYCPYCGGRIPDVGTFCPLCGRKAA